MLSEWLARERLAKLSQQGWAFPKSEKFELKKKHKTKQKNPTRFCLALSACKPCKQVMAVLNPAAKLQGCHLCTHVSEQLPLLWEGINSGFPRGRVSPSLGWHAAGVGTIP